MGIKKDLIKIAGVENVVEDFKGLELYSKDHSLSSPSMPAYTCKPGNVEEVQRIVKLANERKIPVIPCSSGIHFNGTTLPTEGGIMLDLRRMNKILRIDKRNRTATIEPGVTWHQLQDELEKHDLMALCPLLPHPLKSALSSHLEREPMLIPKFEYGDPILNVEIIFANGELFRTGSSCVPGFPEKSASDGVNPQGPGIDWVRIVQNAQGTMGVVTWAIVKTEIKPKVNKTFFIPFNNIGEAIEPIYGIQKKMIGSECLLLNNSSLATILTQKWPEDFEALREVLPPWTLILVLAGGWRRPEERIEYEEEAVNKLAIDLAIPRVLTSLNGVPKIERKLPEMLRKPWPDGRIFWKFGYKGSYQDLYFHTTLARIQDFTDIIGKVAANNGYPIGDIGFYVQPLERARACHYECNFYYNPEDTRALKTIRKLFAEAVEALIDNGAFFTKPYGIIAEMVYDRAATYTIALKKVKGWLDPNNIMSPGRLCF